MKKFLTSKKVFDIFYFIIFALSFCALFCLNEINISIYGIDFCYNKLNGILILILNSILFIFNFLSKNSLRNKRKIFYPFSLLLLILGNLFLISDNIFAIFAILFLIFLINYIFNRIEFSFLNDCLTLFISFMLINFGLMRYFTLNETPFTFLNIAQYQHRIDDFVVNIAFWGFLIIIFRLFNLLPFNIKGKNPYIFSFNTILYLVIGCSLLIKIYILFSFFVYKSQSIIACYLLFNLIYYTFLQIKSKSIIEFIKLTLPANIIISIFGLFTYNEIGLTSLIYYSIVLILTYASVFIITDIVKKKIGTDNFDSLRKIAYKNKLVIIFLFIIFLNFAKLPPFAQFFATAYSFLNIFLIDMPGFIMIVAPYILISCAFLLSLNSLKILSGILVEPTEQIKDFSLALKQKIILAIICFCFFAIGIGIHYIISYLMNIIDV